MVWDPAIPATNADLLSAPVRDNFGALDTALMAALATLANGAVLTKAAGPVIAGVSGVATGAVLASAGVNTAPVWSVSPALTDVKLGGGTIGTSGVGVLALGPSTAPTTSPVDTVQVYAADLNGEAGSTSLAIRPERGGILQMGSFAAGNMSIHTLSMELQIGTIGTNTVRLMMGNTRRLTLWFDGNNEIAEPFYINFASSIGNRRVVTGLLDSAGTGYRTLAVAN
jgi:hypothetical protein